ncbi:MAG: hypothetical protein SNI45_00860 [Rikenellaceae bacterium]
MKSLKVTFGLLAIALCAVTTSASAQVSVSGGADFVSTYVWRGARLGGASIQPYAELAIGDLAIGAWGSNGLISATDEKELDFYVSYSLGNLSATVTNYFCAAESAAYFNGAHVYEATLAYTLSDSFPLSLGVNYNFSGDDDNSAYISLDYSLEVSDVALDLGVGVSPMESAYYGTDGAGVCSVSARVSKSIAITDSFELPMFVDVITNPAAETTFLLFGTSLSF